MANRFKLVALDLDGTFLDSNKKIPARNAEALKKAVSQGVKIMLATSRPYRGAKWVFDEIGVEDGLIMSQAGGLVLRYPDQQVVCSHKFDGALIKEMCEFCDERGIYFHILCGPETYYFNMENDMADLVEKYFFYRGELATADEMAKMESGKANVVTHGMEETLHVLGLLQEAFGDRVELAISDKVSVDINPLGVSKATTLLEAAGVLGIPQEETISFGDTDSDAGMIKAAGMGVAMANASEAAKAAADLIAPSNNECGVAQVFEEYVLEK